MAYPVIEIDGKKYMDTKTAANLWNLPQRTVAKFCRINRIENCFQNDKNRWYISVNEPKPLTDEEIRHLLLLSLQLKNNPKQDIDWSTYSFDDSIIESIYLRLVREGFLAPFDAQCKKRIPYEVVLTQKGFNTALLKKKETNLEFANIALQFLTIIVSAAELLTKAILLS